MEQQKVIIEVISQKGTCSAGHRVGDQWEITGEHAPAGICLYALYTLFPFTQTLAFGGSFPWEEDPDTTTVACPDAENPVVFRIKRVKS